MRIHQLNCGTLTAPGGPLPCRVLLVEAPGGLVLVDTGLGLRDVAEPRDRLGPLRHVIRPALRPAETAVRRIEAMGLDPGDVRHVVLTHLDVDHIGGLADVPAATVHVSTTALTWAIRTPRFVEKRRYRRTQWAHGPRFVEYEFGRDRWEGFRVSRLDDVAEGVLLVDLPGHTRGHSGVYVPGHDGHGGVLHAGDAFYHRGQVDPGVSTPPAIPVRERLMALEPTAIDLTHARLTALAERRRDSVDVVCSHDPSGPGGVDS